MVPYLLVKAARLAAFCLLGCIEFAACAQAAGQQEYRWFQDAKFGMFIHWGPYSVASVEASWPIMVPDSSFSYDDYVTLPGRFNPVKFDAKAWVRLAKAAGQKYIVFTTKHHDGFAMFDATNTDYKITKTPFGRDVFAELAQAAREEGMPLGIYYSPPDMHHPGYRDMTRPAHEHPFGQPERTEWENYLDYMEAQLRQLLTRYGDIAIVWFDGLEGQEKFHGERFHKLIHELQPKALINDRIGVPGDFATPEQRIPKSPNEIAGMWETCMTINDTWAYNKNDRHYKSARDLIWNLADIASKNGNFLLDVGPTPLGTIQPEFRDRLLRIGTWLRSNGEGIYGAVAGPIQDRADLRSTAKGHRVYLYLAEIPKNGRVTIKWSSTSQVQGASILASGKKLRLMQTPSGLEIKVPRSLGSSLIPVIALNLNAASAWLPLILLPLGDIHEPRFEVAGFRLAPRSYYHIDSNTSIL